MKKIFNAIGQHPFIAERPMVRQFMKFGVVGVMNTTLDFLLYTIFTSVWHLYYLVANILSFSIAVTNSYFLNRRWTFRSDNPDKLKEAMKFLTVNLISLGMSEALLFVLVTHLHVHKLTGKVMAIGVVLIWNYLGNRFWAFKRPPSDLPG